VEAVAFSPDGRYVVSGSGDGTARVWEAESGREIARMTHADGITVIAFSPDGKFVISGSEDGTVRLWLWRAEDLIAEACRHLPRNLTLTEWQQYIGVETPYHATCPSAHVPEDAKSTLLERKLRLTFIQVEGVLLVTTLLLAGVSRRKALPAKRYWQYGAFWTGITALNEALSLFMDINALGFNSSTEKNQMLTISLFQILLLAWLFSRSRIHISEKRVVVAWLWLAAILGTLALAGSKLVENDLIEYLLFDTPVFGMIALSSVIYTLDLLKPFLIYPIPLPFLLLFSLIIWLGKAPFLALTAWSLVQIKASLQAVWQRWRKK